MIFGQNGEIVNENMLQPENLTEETQAMIMEAAMMDTLSPEELQFFLESHADVSAATRDEVLMEKSIVRLDKQAKLSRAQKVSVFTIAKEKNDPMFKKLLTVWRMERFLEHALLKKYGNEGMRRAKSSMNKAAKSNSKLVKKVAANVSKQLNSGVKK